MPNPSRKEDVYQAVLEQSGVTLKDVSEKLGLNLQVVSRHLKKLVDEGRIDYVLSNKTRRYYRAGHPSVLLHE